MDKKLNNSDRVRKIWNEVSTYISNKSIGVDQEIFQKQLSCLFFPGPSFNWVLNYTTKEFELVSPGVENIFGVSQEDFRVKRILEIIHPDDIDYLFHCLNLIIRFYTKYIPAEEKFFYKASFHYRAKHISGEYREFLDQHVVLSENEQGQLSKVLINLSDISKFIKPGETRRLSFIDLRGRKSYYYIQSENDFERIFFNENSLTSRELEIIKLISE
jgi:hypothetical protein